MESRPRPSRSALIVAVETYDDPGLQRLRAPGQDAEALASVLSDPEIGGFEVSVSRDESVSRIRPALERFFRDRRRDDVLLLHFSCHGIKDAGGRLYFAASDTDRTLLQTTAVSADLVNELITECRSRNVILLLDCCYSGAFTREMRTRADTSMDVVERFHGSGRAVLTASSALEYAFEGDALSGEGTPSYFTRAVVRGLQSGEADRDGDDRVSIDELYDFVYEEVRRQTPHQTPGKYVKVEGRLIVARSPKPQVPVAVELPTALVEAVASPESSVRLDAVVELARLARARQPALAGRARSLLAQLVTDDSRRVSVAAVAVLAEIEQVQLGPPVPAALSGTTEVPKAAGVGSPASSTVPKPLPRPPAQRDETEQEPDPGPRPDGPPRRSIRSRLLSPFGLVALAVAVVLLGATLSVAYRYLPSRLPIVVGWWERMVGPTPIVPTGPTPVPIGSAQRFEYTWRESVYSAAFSPDGQQVAFASKDGLVMLWDPARPAGGSNPASFPSQHGKTSELTSVDFGGDAASPRMLTTSNDGMAMSWTRQGSVWSPLLVDFRPSGQALWSGALSFDGSRIATAGADGEVRIIGPNPGGLVRLATGSDVWGVAFSRDGMRVVTGSQGGSQPLRVWSTETGRQLWAASSMRDKWVLDVAIDPSGELIAAACNDGEVRLWRGMAEPSFSLQGHGNLPTRSVTFSADGLLLATAGDDGVIRVFDTASAMIVHAIQPTTSDRRVHSVRFSRQGRRLVAAGNNGSVRAYDF